MAPGKDERIIKICNMYFEEINPDETFDSSPVYSYEEAKSIACKGIMITTSNSLKK